MKYTRLVGTNAEMVNPQMDSVSVFCCNATDKVKFFAKQEETILDTQIWYVTSDNTSAYFGVTGMGINLLSNEYVNDKWVATFDGNVESIGGNALQSSTATSVTLPHGVKTIYEYAFVMCSSLTTIKYNGTMSEWNNLSKISGWNTGVPATEVICTDGSVAI